MKAEKRRAWMDWYLGIRLGAITAAAGSLAILAFQLCWTWLLRDLPPSKPLLWLLSLAGSRVYFQAAQAWCNGPMKEAGLGSIVELQGKRTPEAVRECLAHWAEHDTTVQGRQILMPVVRALWRDRLGFIPAYTVFLFFGSWLALSLVQPFRTTALLRTDPIGLLSYDGWTWIPALAGTILCALADYVEDWGELGYVRRFPDEPSRLSVNVTFAATCLKFLLFTAGLLLTVTATLGLAFVQLWRVFHQNAGTISVIVALGALVVSSGAVKGLVSRPQRRAEGSYARHPSSRVARPSRTTER